jgi:hypothetical protein
MSTISVEPSTARKHPFPQHRPDIKIVESSGTIDEIDFVELRWWFSIPRLGDHTWWASYTEATSELDSVTEMVATGPAVMHREDCIEIQINEWSRDGGWKIGAGFFYSRIEEEDESTWLAVVWQDSGKKVFSSFLDKGFEAEWGGEP